jgi:hypothetical protein
MLVFCLLDNRFGSGAATYNILLPIYRSLGDAVVSDLAPSTASAIAIEMGHAALWLFVIFWPHRCLSSFPWSIEKGT